MTSEIPVVAIGASAGGMRALEVVLCELPKDLNVPVVVAQHISAAGSGLIAGILDKKCGVQGREAEDKLPLVPGSIYFAPPNYHMLVEAGLTVALSVDEKVNFSRPSIDVLFESVARACGHNAVGVILTGANEDGSVGLARIKSVGGCTIVQDPQTAEYPLMPQSAIKTGMVDFVVPLNSIAAVIARCIMDRRRPKL